MKKSSLLLASLLLIGATYAQKCKYKQNDFDKFTGKYIKVTKPEKVIGTFYTEGDFSVQKVDTSFTLIFDFKIQSYKSFKIEGIKKGAAINFLLENGEVVTANSDNDITGVYKTFIGIPPVYECRLNSTKYSVSKDKIDKLLKSKVKAIRFYRTGENGAEDYIDNDIAKKNQDDIQDLIKCVL